MISFKNFLVEVFDPNMKVEFGINHPEFTNENFMIVKDDIITFFNYKEYSFCVILSKSDEFFYDVSYLINYRDYIESKDIADPAFFDYFISNSDNNIKNKLIVILNIVLIILIKALRRYKINGLKIIGISFGLDKLYYKILKNKSLLKILDQEGYVIDINSIGRIRIKKKT